MHTILKQVPRITHIQIIVVFLMVMTGCMHRYTPEPLPIDSKTLRFKIDNITIAIVNNQKDNNEKIIREHAGHKYYANLNQWTESATNLLRDEIITRGGIISEKSKRTVSLSIIEVSLEFFTWTRKCRILLDVHTGDGYSVTYEGIGFGGIGRGEVYAINAAISSAVEAILSDIHVANYITKSNLSKSTLERLEQLNAIRTRGLITIEEYEIKKKQILDGL